MKLHITIPREHLTVGALYDEAEKGKPAGACALGQFGLQIQTTTGIFSLPMKERTKTNTPSGDEAGHWFGGWRAIKNSLKDWLSSKSPQDRAVAEAVEALHTPVTHTQWECIRAVAESDSEETLEDFHWTLDGVEEMSHATVATCIASVNDELFTEESEAPQRHSGEVIITELFALAGVDITWVDRAKDAPLEELLDEIIAERPVFETETRKTTVRKEAKAP